MKYRFVLAFFCLFFISLFLPLSLRAQEQTSIDAVGISTKYYNSIVKILLYDSVAARTDPEKAYLGRGSGFFVTDDGYIFTNKHVIKQAYYGFCRYTTYDEDQKAYVDNVDDYKPELLTDPNTVRVNAVGRAAIIVQLFTNEKGDSSKLYYARVVALDTANFDGAIIKIVSDLYGRPVKEKFHAVPIGNSDSIQQGQDLCLFGFPAQYTGGFQYMLRDLSTLIFGKHSGYDFRYSPVYGFIKTDAVISSGNSGGPVFGPNNRVVGIATAAFVKTNVGLIGGIDAMYYVAALIPDLMKSVVANGLTAPQRVPLVSKVTLANPFPHLPTPKEITHSNNLAVKKSNAIAKPYVVLSLSDGVVGSTKFTVPAYNGTSYSASQNTYSVPFHDYAFNLRIVKPTFLKQKNNLVGYFINLSPGIFVPSWQSVRPFKYENNAVTNDTGSIINNPEINVYISFGFSYTYLFNKIFSLGAYYAPAGDLAVPIDDDIGQNIDYTRSQTFSIAQTLGIIFKANAFCLQLDFRYNNAKVNYIFPDNTGTPPSGSSSRSILSLTFGVAL